MSSADVLLGYQQRVEQLQLALGEFQTKQSLSLIVLTLAVLIALYFSFLAFARRTVPLWYPPLSLPVVLVSVRSYARQRLLAANILRLRNFYDKGLERMEDRWAGNGVSGEEFEDADHIYAADLNLFGEGSLFERLCTARTHLGRERLARYMQQPATLAEVQQRQQAVRELIAHQDLREKIAQLGRYDFQESRWQTFSTWLGSPPAEFASWMRPVTLASSIILAALVLTLALMPSLWPQLRMGILPLVAFHALLGAYLRDRVHKVITNSSPAAAEITLIQEGLDLLAAQKFVTPKLVSLTHTAASAGPVLRLLKPWFAILRERNSDWFYWPSIFFLLGSQSALAIEEWRMRNQDAFKQWLDAWAEFEALNSIACYAYENPDDCWADVAEGGASFTAEGLGHPLLSRDVCVRNDVALGGPHRFGIISGSNMAGKSTMLRSIGLAAVLAFAGAPVRARALKLGLMRICASISILDSLREGKSKFLAEVERLRNTLVLADSHPVLFLIDEIFSGTNSPDRRAAADAVVRTLVARGAIGAFSTHDIALAAISQHGGVNLHMASREGSANPLDFDYRLKPGVTTESNALAIARMVGVPV